MDRIKIELGDITEFKGHAIVNSANEQLSGGGGVNGAIHRAAGPQLLEKCQTLGGCKVGKAKITGGYNLKARHVIHTVGPIWKDGENGEGELLANCYNNSLWLAEEHQLRTMAFPAISSGANGYPKEEAAQIAIATIKLYLGTYKRPEQITFMCFDTDTLVLYETVNEEEYIDPVDPNCFHNIHNPSALDGVFNIITGKYMSICAAAYTGTSYRVKEHLEAGVNINDRADGQSPLHFAAEGAASEPIKLLIDRGADVNKKNHEGNTPLHLVALKGKKKITNAQKQVISETINLLTTEGADVNSRNDKGNTPLHLAARTGHIETNHLLIDDGADINAKNEQGDTPLHFAAQLGQKKTIALLIAKDADEDSKNNDGQTPVDVADNEKTGDFIRKEFRKRKPPTPGDDILIQIRKGDIDAVKKYISDGGELNKADSSTGSTLLHHACAHDRKEIAGILIDNGADVNAKNKKNSDTPLHYAARKSFRITEFLLEKKADVNAENDQGKKPRDVARSGSIDDLLRKHGGKTGDDEVMALIECYECGKEISSLAPACPSCGAPKEEKLGEETGVDPPIKPKEGLISVAKTLDGYKLPKSQVLDEPDAPSAPTETREQLLANARLLKDTLEQFKIEVNEGDITKGPTITRYELHPAPGVKLERITGLANNIAAAIKAERINILAPVPGRNTVGIEVPNRIRTKVPFRDIVESPEWRNSRAKIPLAQGKDVYGKPIVADLAEMPHLLIAGATGSGKSVCINSIVASLLFRFTPEELRIVMIDPKFVQWNICNDLPHLVSPVVHDMKEAILTLKWVVNEVKKRYQMFAKVGARNIVGFNSRTQKKSPREEDIEIPEKLGYIVVIIDEFADLMLMAKNNVENSIARITQMARAVGIHCIVTTHLPSVDVITDEIKTSIPARIAFLVAAMVDSQTILDDVGAEKLLGKGDMLFRSPGTANLRRIQGCLVTDEEINRIVEIVKIQ